MALLFIHLLFVLLLSLLYQVIKTVNLDGNRADMTLLKRFDII